MMSVDNAECILAQARDTLLLGGIDLIETREIPHGWQLRGAAGEIVNIYTTGKAVAQGKKAAIVKGLFEARRLPALARKPPPEPTDHAIQETRQSAPKQGADLPTGWSDVWRPGDVPF